MLISIVLWVDHVVCVIMCVSVRGELDERMIMFLFQSNINIPIVAGFGHI